MLKLMMELKQINVFYVTADWYTLYTVFLDFPNLPIIRNSKFKNWSRIKNHWTSLWNEKCRYSVLIIKGDSKTLNWIWFLGGEWEKQLYTCVCN